MATCSPISSATAAFLKAIAYSVQLQSLLTQDMGAPDTELKILVEIHLPDANFEVDGTEIEILRDSVGAYLEQIGFAPDPYQQAAETFASWHRAEWFRSMLPSARAESKMIYGDLKEALRRQQIDQAGAGGCCKADRVDQTICKSRGSAGRRTSSQSYRQR